MINYLISEVDVVFITFQVTSVEKALIKHLISAVDACIGKLPDISSRYRIDKLQNYNYLLSLVNVPLIKYLLSAVDEALKNYLMSAVLIDVSIDGLRHKQ